MYRAYLNSQEVDAIFAGNRAALAGIDILRKICNHPDLIERTKWEGSEQYGKPERSGKLTVTMKVTSHCCTDLYTAQHMSSSKLLVTMKVNLIAVLFCTLCIVHCNKGDLCIAASLCTVLSTVHSLAALSAACADLYTAPACPSSRTMQCTQFPCYQRSPV